MCRKKFMSCVLVFVAVFSLLIVPAHADYVNTSQSYWDRALHRVAQGELLGFPLNGLIGQVAGSVCETSEDGYHHTDDLQGCVIEHDDKHGDYAIATCKYCGKHFNVYGADLSQVYTEYVEDLPATGIDNDGGLIWYPTLGDFVSLPRVRVFGNYIDLDSLSEVSGNYHVVWSYDLSNSFITFRLWSENSSSSFDSSKARIEFASSNLNVPISGHYSRLSSPNVIGTYRNDDGTFNFDNDFFFMYSSSDSTFYDSTISVGLAPFVHSSAPFYETNFILYLPVYRVVPSSGAYDITSSGDIYNVNTRAGSITGDYGVLGDNNTITKADTTYIFSEDDNSLYNPVTNTTTTYDSWSYDYSDRSYHLTTEEGDTTTVTYGDENITIKEGDTTYTVYYIYQTGSGDDSGGGSGGGGSDSGSGIFERLGELVGTVLGGILSMIEAVVGKLLDALTSLAGMISDKLAQIVEMVLSWFDEIPKMFGGFLDFLGAIFPFLPPEIMLLLTFGLAAVIFIGIVKAIRR